MPAALHDPLQDHGSSRTSMQPSVSTTAALLMTDHDPAWATPTKINRVLMSHVGTSMVAHARTLLSYGSVKLQIRSSQVI